MNENKLIAEFMGWEYDELSEKFITPYLKIVDDQAFGDDQLSSVLADYEMEFHTSWDWLMPVVEKIMDMSFQNDGECEDFYSIRDCIPEIGQTYKAVVEFIKEK